VDPAPNTEVLMILNCFLFPVARQKLYPHGAMGGAVAVWVASRPEACRLSQLQGCGFESAPLTSIA